MHKFKFASVRKILPRSFDYRIVIKSNKENFLNFLTMNPNTCEISYSLLD